MGLLLFALQSCSQMNSTNDKPFAGDALPASETTLDTAYFGAGCFWCVEAVFQELQGVYKVESGYMGGQHPQSQPTKRSAPAVPVMLRSVN